MVHIAVETTSPKFIQALHSILGKVDKGETFYEEQEEMIKVAIKNTKILKHMFTRNKPSEYNQFRFFMEGTRNNPVRFPNGMIYEGVSDQP
mmetsp:Transcript_38987/g.37303  ORF Transcript_38987/g.37303 Transcript_38987/m.37303 type:complete len:91 (+) Transcript_38987:330-602(+)